MALSISATGARFIKECDRMDELKEKIIGMVRIMDEKGTEMAWQLIQAAFHLAKAEAVEPGEEEIFALSEYQNGNPDYRPSHTHEEVLQTLGLQ